MLPLDLQSEKPTTANHPQTTCYEEDAVAVLVGPYHRTPTQSEQDLERPTFPRKSSMD